MKYAMDRLRRLYTRFLFWVPRTFSNHMEWQACTGDTEFIKTDIGPKHCHCGWWGEGAKTTETVVTPAAFTPCLQADFWTDILMTT